MEGFFFFITICFGLFITIFWLVVAWRAMRAHENISYALNRYVALQESVHSDNFRKEAGTTNRLYKQFVSEQPESMELLSKERHDAFRVWLEKRGESE